MPTDELVDRAWGERPPQRTRETLYSYVSRLRTALAPADDVRLTRRPAGYLLTVDPDAVDVHRFHRLAAAAHASRDGEAALDLFEQALGLWHGAAFAALDTPWLNGVRAALDRTRFGAELERFDLALRCGRHTRVLAAMSAANATNPLDERLAGQLMLALYRAGRQGEALACYRRLQLRLVEELGIDPGEPVRQLHQRILRADPTLMPHRSTVDRVTVGSTTGDPAAPGRAPAGRAEPRVPWQVPVPPATFTGRADELAALSALVGPAGPDTGGVRAAVCSIVGPGGIGKTWIARRWAYEHRSRYPDGQLYVDLRGFDPTGPPVPSSAAIRGFLDGLGVAPEAIPAHGDAQAGLYRSLVADKRLLIVLDNARDSAHAVPLLPGAAGCTVLVTSRHHLVGLVTTQGARPLALGLLPVAEARQVLVGHLGARRIAAEPTAVDAVLRHCGGLPLALGIVSARAAVHADLPLGALAAELAAAATRLDALDAGELAVDLRVTLSCSTDSLTAAAQRLFALFGLIPGPDVGLFPAAGAAGLPVAVTQNLLRQLTAAHLVTEPDPGRYRMHDLVRLFAAEQTDRLDEQPPARRRLLDHYLYTGFAANRLLAPMRDAIELPAPAPGLSVTPVSNHVDALAWFHAEHATLLATVHQAVDWDHDSHAWQLAWTMATYLDRHARWHDQAAVHMVAWTAARRLGDRAAQVYTLRGLARAQIWLGRYEEARGHLRQALDLLDDLDDPTGRADLHRALARSYARAGEPGPALTHDSRALALYRAVGHRSGQATALNAIGWHHAHLGHHDRALRICRRALTLHQTLGDRHGTAVTLDSLGYIHRHLGRYDRAIGHYQDAVDLFGELGDHYEMAGTLAGLGDTHAGADDLDRARDAWHRAATVLDELGVPAAPVRSKLRAAGDLSTDARHETGRDDRAVDRVRSSAFPASLAASRAAECT